MAELSLELLQSMIGALEKRFEAIEARLGALEVGMAGIKAFERATLEERAKALSRMLGVPYEQVLAALRAGGPANFGTDEELK
jgi:hypothetical protein